MDWSLACGAWEPARETIKIPLSDLNHRNQHMHSTQNSSGVKQNQHLETKGHTPVRNS